MNCPVTCQSVQLQMADFSAGHLSPLQAHAFEQHCASCDACQCEWETFQNTLELLSALPQAVPCEELSHEMWDCCCQDWMSHVEERRCKNSPLNALRRSIHWINQQPRWAQGGSVASSVVVAGVVLFWSSAWVASSKAPIASNVVASNSSAVPVASLPDASLPSDGGPLRLMGPSAIGVSPLPYNSPPVNISESSIPLLPSRRVGLDNVPFSASGSDYWNNQQSLPKPLPVERFINRVANTRILAPSAQARTTPHSSVTPFVWEGRTAEKQMQSSASLPLMHGE
ncbi:MAG TPA: hypothetical protein VGB77_18000 [Abditibacteriaceae bacterium]